MKYISGIHALNLNCSLETTGDWHQSALKWENITFLESSQSIFGEFGIEHNKLIPLHKERFHVADHLRAILDLLDLGHMNIIKGMRNNFICTDIYDMILFEKVLLLEIKQHWQDIDDFMHREYGKKWRNFRRART